MPMPLKLFAGHLMLYCLGLFLLGAGQYTPDVAWNNTWREQVELTCSCCNKNFGFLHSLSIKVLLTCFSNVPFSHHLCDPVWTLTSWTEQWNGDLVGVTKKLSCLCAPHLHLSICLHQLLLLSPPPASPVLLHFAILTVCTICHILYVPNVRVFMSLPVIMYTGLACNIHYEHEYAVCLCLQACMHAIGPLMKWCFALILSVSLSFSHVHITLNVKSHNMGFTG